MSSIGIDRSGNGNNWTSNNLTQYDVMVDSPTNNFAVWNPLRPNAAMTYANGNTQARSSGGSGRSGYSNVGMASGKWYMEIIGVVNNVALSDTTGSPYFQYKGTGSYNNNGSTTTGKATYGATDIIGISYNADTNAIEFYKNNVSQGSATFSAASGVDVVLQFNATFNVVETATVNFGADSSFAGTKTPQGNQDSNGIGDFYYAPPTGFLALCTANLPDVDVIPSEHFNTVLYSGDNGTQAITGVGFGSAPDFTWIKARNATARHDIYDVVRGAKNSLSSQETSAEQASNIYGYLDSFDTDGFTVKTGTNNAGRTNQSGYNYVAWNWKAGGSVVSNTNGTITSQVSANPAAGFSIVSYTGNNVTASTIGHGLSSAPLLRITKNRDTSVNWFVHTTVIDGTLDYLHLNTTGAKLNSGQNAPDSTVFTVGVSTGENAVADYIAYCFHSVESYSKVGKYIGNGSADGTFVHCGFRPAYVMVKRTDAASNWAIYDAARDTYNAADTFLYADGSTGDQTYGAIDFVSNGFKHRSLVTALNASGGTYIFLAFAESPFKFSNAR